MDSPDVLRVFDSIGASGKMMTSLYECSYAEFFVALASVTDSLKTDVYFGAHAGFYCKEMRVKAYTQMLESYRSVQLQSMATSFGVTADFLDK
jgi:26S proteasome regulatory subunit N7